MRSDKRSDKDRESDEYKYKDVDGASEGSDSPKARWAPPPAAASHSQHSESLSRPAFSLRQQM